METAIAWTGALALAACLGGAWAGIRGARLLMLGIRGSGDPEASLRVIRGLRGLIVGVCAVALAAGLLLEQRWLLVFGGLWLAEEIYETGVLALILRAGLRASSEPTLAGRREGVSVEVAPDGRTRDDLERRPRAPTTAATAAWLNEVR
jgi:hypothetical protein